MLDYLGRPATYADCYSGNTSALQQKLTDPVHSRAIKTNMVSDAGRTLLHEAVSSGYSNVATVKTLVENGVKVKDTDHHKRNVMLYAANGADPEILQYIISTQKKPHKLIKDTDRDKRNALHALFIPGTYRVEERKKNNIKQIVEILFNALDAAGRKHKAQALAQQDIFGMTPFMYAKYYGHTNIFPYNEFTLPIIPVISSDHVAVARDYFGRNKLMRTAFAGDEDKFMEALDASADPIDINPLEANSNALLVALKGYPSKAIIKHILANTRTNPIATDSIRTTPLHLTVYMGRLDLVELLLANVQIYEAINSKDKHGRTALHALVMYQETNTIDTTARFRIAEMLFNAKIDPDVRFNKQTADVIAMERHNNLLASKITDLAAGIRDLEADKEVKGPAGCLFFLMPPLKSFRDSCVDLDHTYFKKHGASAQDPQDKAEDTVESASPSRVLSPQ